MSILEVHDVSIRYMTGDFKDIGLKEYATRKLKGNYHVNEFWADKNISFTLEKGDMLGIIGTNGAGKSTLLKAVSGIMEPTGGYVKREGNIAALLELASGFDGDLTVRENAYLRGAMLGYTRRFMDEKYDEIIDFAELQDFQDRPFKQLSSGMKSRLAFSIASLVAPDILILDEVLSVGDGAFRKKSEEKMREIIAGGATTILVSHSIQQVREMCNKVLWLEKGQQVAFGDNVEAICGAYQQYLDHNVTLEQAKGKIDEGPERGGDREPREIKKEAKPEACRETGREVPHKSAKMGKVPGAAAETEGEKRMENAQIPFAWPRWRDPWKGVAEPVQTAFWSACLLGIITHIYIFTNLILNHDSVWRIFYNNDNTASGRWFLKVLSDASTQFQLPVVIGVISILMLALTAGLTVSVLEASNRVTAILISAFLVTFPSVACIFSYMFTADAYFICLFLNTLAVYLAKRYSWGWLPAVVLCALACGGYQAFICYAIGLFLIDCILELFSSEREYKEILKKGIKYIAIVIASLLLYYSILMVITRVRGIALGAYQGISSINLFNIKGFLSQIPLAYKNFALYFKATPYNTKPYQVIQILFFGCTFGAMLYLAVATRLYREVWRVAFLIIGIGLFPLALNFITVLSVGAQVHALMIYSFVLGFVFSLKLIETAVQKMVISGTSCWNGVFLISAALAAMLVWNNFCVSNTAYLRLQVCYENSFALANRIVARIERLDGYSPKLPVAIVGEADRSLYGGIEGGFSQFNSLTGTTDKLLFSPEPHHRTRVFIEDYIGLHMLPPSKEQKEILKASEEIKELPSYPQEGSVILYNDVIVVKLGEGEIR